MYFEQISMTSKTVPSFDFVFKRLVMEQSLTSEGSICHCRFPIKSSYVDYPWEKRLQCLRFWRKQEVSFINSEEKSSRYLYISVNKTFLQCW